MRNLPEFSVSTWIGVLWMGYYLAFTVAKPTIVCSKELVESVRQILSNSATIYSRYWPNLIFNNGLLQTGVGKYLRPSTSIKWTHETIKTDDGGSLMLAWASSFKNSKLYENTPLLVVLPGLTGDETEWYILNLVDHVVNKLNWRCVVYVRRGCNIPLTGDKIKPQDYCDGSKFPSGDLALILEKIRLRYPNAPLLGAGYSLGSNYLVSHLGKAGKRTPFLSAVSIGCPFDLVGCSYWTKHVNRIVGRSITTHRKMLIHRQRTAIMSAFSDEQGMSMLESLLSAENYRACAKWNMSSWGGKGLNEYLERSSCENYVDGVRVPLLFISSLDDPVAHPNFINYEVVQKNPHCVLCVTSRGGHHTYLDLLPFRMAWCDRACVDWLENAVKLFRNQSCLRIQRWYRKTTKKKKKKKRTNQTNVPHPTSPRRSRSLMNLASSAIRLRLQEREDEAARRRRLSLDRDAFVAKLYRKVKGDKDNDDENLILSYVQLPSWRKAMLGRLVVLLFIWPLAVRRILRYISNSRYKPFASGSIGLITAFLSMWVHTTWRRRHSWGT